MIKVTTICDVCEKEFAGFTMKFWGDTIPAGANLGKVIVHKGYRLTLCDRCHDMYLSVLEKVNAMVEECFDDVQKEETETKRKGR